MHFKFENVGIQMNSKYDIKYNAYYKCDYLNDTYEQCCMDLWTNYITMKHTYFNTTCSNLIIWLVHIDWKMIHILIFSRMMDNDGVTNNYVQNEIHKIKFHIIVVMK